jgi:hypothetical protein
MLFVKKLSHVKKSKDQNIQLKQETSSRSDSGVGGFGLGAAQSIIEMKEKSREEPSAPREKSDEASEGGSREEHSSRASSLEPKFQKISAGQDSSMLIQSRMGEPLAGNFCGIKKPEQHVIRSKKEAEKLIKRLEAPASADMLRGVDYSKNMVVAVFMGEQPTAGYGIWIVGAAVHDREANQPLVISVKRVVPSEDAVSAAILTQPFHLKILPAYSGPVRFEDVN